VDEAYVITSLSDSQYDTMLQPPGLE